MTLALIWKVITSRLAGPVASAVALAALVVALIALTAFKVTEGRLAARNAEAASLRARVTSCEGKVASLDAARRQETRQAVEAVEAVERRCAGRVADARRSSLAIEKLISMETPRDQNGCAVRVLVPAERLRDALTPGG